MTLPRNDHVGDATLARILERAAQRVKDINETTREQIRQAIAAGVNQGEGAAQLGDRIAQSAGLSEYRGELIARTETMQAWNVSAIESYRDAGIQLVQAQDGDADEMCANRMARDTGYGPGVYTLDEAAAELEHPNGTLSWSPVVDIRQLRQDVREAGLGGSPVSMAELDRVTSDLVSRARAAEPRVTADIEAIGERTGLNPNTSFELDGKTLRTLDARLKTEGSTFRKVSGELEANPGKTLRQVEESMKDNLRYTYVSEPGAYNAGVRAVVDELVAAGYEPVRATNYWIKGRGYAGLNTNWRTSNGQMFEVQFHTQRGLEVKEVLSHPLYERQRLLPDWSWEWDDVQREIDAGWATFRRENPGLGIFDWLRTVFAEVR